ncbi:MAG: methyltransferase domain-containing protein [Nitrospinota bacterium]|nr:methyltransferase domain-containing protein [Nitrospinota bacterium]
MDEASKTEKIRGQEFRDNYFSGKVLDIVCGDNLVVSNAVPFDKEQGDAQEILNYLEPNTFDCVHSSHSLEHMSDVPKALGQWWQLVKPGGTMVIVVPDEDLYEQGVWPSLFNRDHSATFRFNKPDSWSPVSYDLGRVCSSLPDAEVISLEHQDEGYDHSLKGHGLGKQGRFFMRLNRSIIKRLNRYQKLITKLGISPQFLKYRVNLISVKLGALVDQTLEDAVAQIQIVLRKKVEN